MKCYYEVLGIERDSTPDQIKKAHRKLALKWHPDKNKDNVEEAHKVYQVIQEAYDCLSDPQEKAFYDKHREQILRGGSDHKSEDINVMGFYGSSCYNGFTDLVDGFYKVYSDLFVKISEEDHRYVDTKDWEEPPRFGTSTSEFEEVRQFYGWWQSYCTKRSYMWLDELYDIRQADGRRVLRAMEKENKKLIDEAKKEYNESVRSLVLHIKKKDPRCVAQKEKQKLLEEERLVAEKKRKEEQRRKRAEEIERITEQEKDMIAQHEERLDELLDQFSDSDDEEDPFYCPLCRKLFKSDKMMKQHEKSKKHKEKLAELQGEFASELQAAGLAEQPTTDETPTPSTKKKKKKKNRRQQALEEEDLYDVSELNQNPPESEEISEALNGCNLNDKVEDEKDQTMDLKTEPEDPSSIKSEGAVLHDEQKTEPTSEKERVGPARPAEDAPEEEWREYMSHYYTREETTYCGVPVLTRPPPGDNRELSSQNNPNTDSTNTDLSKTDYTIINTAPPPKPSTDIGPKKSSCNMCGASFASKTKLFAHLKETGHAIKKEFVQKPAGNKKGKKGKKR